MRNVRAVLFAIGTLITLVTFVGFAMFSPDEAEPPAETPRQAAALPPDTGMIAGRVAAFVLANEMLAPAPEPLVDDYLTAAALAEYRPEAASPPAATSTTQPPTTQPPTTTTRPPTTTEPPTTTTEPPSTTTPATGPLSEAAMRSLAASYFPAAEVEKAVLVAKCESGWNADVVSSNGLYGGLFQHAFSHWESRAASAGWAGADIFDPAANTAVAARLLEGSSWDSHWPFCSGWADGQLGG